jgi:hypothetical protein
VRPWLTTLAPILISFSFRLDSDQSLIGSGVASVRRKLPPDQAVDGPATKSTDFPRVEMWCSRFVAA